MARKWLDIGVIGHKWTQQEYKKGRFLLVEINEEFYFKHWNRMQSTRTLTWSILMMKSRRMSEPSLKMDVSLMAFHRTGFTSIDT